MSRGRIFIFGIPQHGNLGDQAIAEAEAAFIAKYSTRTLVEIPMEESEERIAEVKSVLQPEDIIAWHGGGNFGTIWPNEEHCRQAVLAEFSDHPIIIFPQSIYFDLKDKKSLKKSQDLYNSLPNLTLFVREQVSYDLAQQILDVHCVRLVPDIVLSYSPEISAHRRDGAITLLRSDKEKKLRQSDQAQIIKLLRQQFDYVTESDTVIDEFFGSRDKRRDILNQVFSQIISKEVVVTDRLHGMIFAYITHTPCVVLENSNHKIRSTYETWLKTCKAIKIIESPDQLHSAIKSVTAEHSRRHSLSSVEFHELIQLIK